MVFQVAIGGIADAKTAWYASKWMCAAIVQMQNSTFEKFHTGLPQQNSGSHDTKSGLASACKNSPITTSKQRLHLMCRRLQKYHFNECTGSQIKGSNSRNIGNPCTMDSSSINISCHLGHGTTTRSRDISLCTKQTDERWMNIPDPYYKCGQRINWE